MNADFNQIKNAIGWVERQNKDFADKTVMPAIKVRIDGLEIKDLMKIPKIIHQIWVGPKKPPLEWMKTWQNMPGWEYMLWDNEKVANFPFKNRKHIDYYMSIGRYAGICDLVSYEALYNFGGVIAGADSVRLLPYDDLLDIGDNDCFSVPECSEEELKRIGYPDLVMPLIGSTKGNDLAKICIDRLFEKESVAGSPWRQTGNLFFGQLLKEVNYPRIKMYPYYYFIPEHHRGHIYKGNDKIYASHKWGTTKGLYDN